VNLREKDWKLDPRNRYFELQAKLEGIKIGEQKAQALWDNKKIRVAINSAYSEGAISKEEIEQIKKEMNLK
jgi:hypothetical protein